MIAIKMKQRKRIGRRNSTAVTLDREEKRTEDITRKENRETRRTLIWSKVKTVDIRI